MLKKVTQIISHHQTPSLGAPVDTLTLNFQQRQCRRGRFQTDHGLEFILDLPQTTVLTEKDGLQLEDNAWIMVQAAPENTLHIHCKDPTQLARIAWHLGNRHCATQILPTGLRILYDAVLEKMLHGLNASTEVQLAPFSPEGGAYATAHAHE